MSSEGQSFRSYCLAGLAYFLITLFFTYPMILDPFKEYIESPFGGSNDQFVCMWDAWWVKKALLDLHSSPLSTQYLCYPDGADLSLHELTIANSIVTIPFQLVLPKPYGVVTGFNITILLSFLIAGVGAYALFDYLTHNAYASFVGGLAFAFAPYRTMHIIHIALLSTGWFPLYLLFLLKTVRERRFLDACLAGLCILLTFYSCMSYIYFSALATIIVVGYYVVSDRKQLFHRRTLGLLALIGGFGVIAIIPQLLLAVGTNGNFEQPYDVVSFFSANMAGYLIPASKQLLFRPIYSLVPRFFMTGIPGEATFLGYTLIGLVAIGLWKAKPSQWGLWALLATFFFVLSLGPSLHLLGHSYDIRLPYAFLYKYLPLFNVMRTPYRFAVFVTLGCAGIACFGLNALSRTPQDGVSSDTSRVSGTRAKVVAAVAGSLMLIEMWNIPFISRKAVVPEFYFEVQHEEGNFGILDLPGDKYRNLAIYMFYQTVHEKPIADGLISRRNQGKEQKATMKTFERYTKPEDLDVGNRAWLQRRGFRYVVFHSIVDDRDTITDVVKCE